jgi:hypothetical protein
MISKVQPRYFNWSFIECCLTNQSPQTYPQTETGQTGVCPRLRKRGLTGIPPPDPTGPRYGPGRRRDSKPIPRYLKLTPAQIATKIEKLGIYIRERGTAGLVEYELALTRELIGKIAGKTTNAPSVNSDPCGEPVGGDLGSARMSSRPKPKAARNASWKPRLASWPNPGAQRVDVTADTRGQTYNVTYNRSLIVTASRTPTLDAARALLARGITGKLEVYGGREPPAPGGRYRGCCWPDGPGRWPGPPGASAVPRN